MFVAWRANPGGPRAPLRSNFDDPEAFSEEECSQQDVVQHMVPVAGSPIIMCGTFGCSGSCPVSVVEYGYQVGKKPATCRTCGKIFPRLNVSGIKSRNASPTRSQKPSVASWSEALCEQSRSQVETVFPAAVGPCAPSEPVPLSSGFVVTSEHAVISGLSAGSFAPVQGISRVHCAVTHGFGGVGSVPRATYISTPSKPVFFSSGIEVTSEHAGISVFSAESSAPVQGTSCVDRAVSHGFDESMSGASQLDVGTQYAHVGYPGVELVSRAMYISRKKRHHETVQRHSKALKEAQRDAKRKFVAQPEISHEAAELILRNQAIRTDEKFPGTIHVSHHLALLHGHENVFFLYTVWCRQRWWSFEATEVSVRRIWRIPLESETQA